MPYGVGAGSTTMAGCRVIRRRVLFERRILRLAAFAIAGHLRREGRVHQLLDRRAPRGSSCVRWMRATPREQSAAQTFSYNTTSARRNL